MSEPIAESVGGDPASVVKLVALLRRKPELTDAEFIEHWRDRHGPLIRDTPTIAQHILRYEQHARYSDSPWAGSDGVDGVAVQWFKNYAAWEAFLAEPDYARLIAPDEARFLDTSTIRFMICAPPTIVIGS